MYWTGIAVDRVFPERDVQQAWARALQLPVDAVAVIDDFGDADPWVDDRVQFAVERRIAAGEFPLRLALVIGHETLDAQVQADSATLAAVQRFCAELGCRALIAIEDEDPSAWVLVTPTERLRIADYDPDDEAAKIDEAIAEALAVAVS